VTYLTDLAANGMRWVWRLRREPVTLLVDLLQPVLWLLLFGHLFSFARAGLGLHVSYLTFMTAGVAVMTVFNVALAGGLEVMFDRESGMLRRLLVTPMHRSTLLAGRFVFVVLIGLAQVVVILAAGRLFGVAWHEGLGGIAAILVFDTLLGTGMATLSLVLAFRLRNHGPFYTIIGFVSLPLTFVSTAFAPLHTMSGWLRTLAGLNPLTYAVNAVRALLIGPGSLDALLRLGLYLAVFDGAALALGIWVFRRALY
jgi:ABC-2 type transport system permease protein